MQLTPSAVYSSSSPNYKITIRIRVEIHSRVTAHDVSNAKVKAAVRKEIALFIFKFFDK